MNDMMKMLGKPSKADAKMSPEEVKAKMEVLKELFDMAHEAMGHKVKSGMDEMHKVSVMAPDKQGLHEGLETADALMGDGEEESPEEERAEESAHEDMDRDMEHGESDEHAAEVLGSPEAKEDSAHDMSADAGEEESPFAKKAAMMDRAKEEDKTKKKKGLFSMED